MKVVFTVWSGTIGGAESLTWRLVHRLRDSNHVDARVIVLGDDGPIADAMRGDGIPVGVVGASTAPGLCIHTNRLESALAGFQPDVVVLGGYGLACFAIRRVLPRTPVVVVEHGGILLNPRSVGVRHYSAVIAGRVGYAHTTLAEVAVSRFMMAVQRRIPHAARLVFISNAVDTMHFRPSALGQRRSPSEPLRVVAAGRLADYKGFDDLIRAIATCNTSHGAPLASLTIAGDGPDRERLERLTDSLQARSAVHFIGPTVDMPAFWSAGEVACVPSRATWRESFGLTAAEAQACGLPAIVTDVGALSEVVHSGVSGCVVPPSNPARLAAAIRLFALEPEVLARQAAAARRRAVRHFSLARAAARYHALLEDVAGAS